MASADGQNRRHDDRQLPLWPHALEQHSAEGALSLVSQADIYDSLRRICELEDAKSAIQSEIDVHTTRLRQCVPGVDQGSLLYEVLTSALASPSPPQRRSTTLRK